MAYHVFILSPVRELWEGGLSIDEAVRRGNSTTAGTVTSAAAVMIGVFMTLTFLDFKELGLGLAAAVLIRRDDHPRRAAARLDEAARDLELVPAAVTGVAPARRCRARCYAA